MNCAPNAPQRIHVFILFAVPAFAPQPSATSYSKGNLRSLNTGTQTNLSVIRVAEMAALVTGVREPDVSFRFDIGQITISKDVRFASICSNIGKPALHAEIASSASPSQHWSFATVLDNWSR